MWVSNSLKNFLLGLFNTLWLLVIEEMKNVILLEFKIKRKNIFSAWLSTLHLAKKVLFWIFLLSIILTLKKMTLMTTQASVPMKIIFISPSMMMCLTFKSLPATNHILHVKCNPRKSQPTLVVWTYLIFLPKWNYIFSIHISVGLRYCFLIYKLLERNK